MKNEILFIFLILFKFFIISSVYGISLSDISAELEARENVKSFFLITQNGSVEVEPVTKCQFYNPVAFMGIPLTVSQSEVVTISADEIKSINFVAKEGSLYELRPRIDIAGFIEKALIGIKDPVRFFMSESGLLKLARCQKEGEYLNCTIDFADLYSKIFNNPDRESVCLLFISYNREKIKSMIADLEARYYPRLRCAAKAYAAAVKDVYNNLASKRGVRIFCIKRNLPEGTSKKPEQKEETQ